MKGIVNEISVKNIDELITCIENNTEASKASLTYAERCEYLQLTTPELIGKYTFYIKDERVYEHLGNYRRLLCDETHCDNKLKDYLDNRFVVGAHHNIWNKIKYIHALMKLGNISLSR